MKVKNQTYARITGYGDLLIPLSLLEKVSSEAFIVSTTYESGEEHLSDIREVTRIELHSPSEIESAIAQKALEGK